MMAQAILLGIAAIIFFGYFAEYVFRKTAIPDILLLILLGFLLSFFVKPSQLGILPQVFTVFTLIFLMFEGAFNIASEFFLKEWKRIFSLALFNYLISSAFIFAVLKLLGYSFLVSSFIGLILGGVSSSFVIPLLSQMKVRGDLYSLLTLEAALTDVFTIGFSITVMEIMSLHQFSISRAVSSIVVMFLIAVIVGFAGALLWCFLERRVFKPDQNYMATIALLIFVYLVAEFLRGSGAIAALVYGWSLKNSSSIISLLERLAYAFKGKTAKTGVAENFERDVISEKEKTFYDEITFFLKTFFFVYIGMLLYFTSFRVLGLGLLMGLGILSLRKLSTIFVRDFQSEEKALVSSIYARGIAAAAVLQIALAEGMNIEKGLVGLVNFVIVLSIILSSVEVFLLKRKIRITDLLSQKEGKP